MPNPNLPEPFVVAICYPMFWWTDPPGAADAARAELIAVGEAAGHTVELIEPTYEEAHERRAGKGAEPDKDWLSSQPELTPEATEGFARMHAALALDIPVDIADRAPNLQWVQAFGAGSDHFTPSRLADSNITLTNSAGANAIASPNTRLAGSSNTTKSSS